MTIIHGDKFQNLSQKRKSKISEDQKGKMTEASPKQLHHISDVQHELQKKQRQSAALKRRAAMLAKSGKYGKVLELSQTCGMQKIRIKEDGVHRVEERNLYEGEVPEETTTGESIDDLLILACSAELMLDLENSFHTSQRNTSNDEGSESSPIAQKSQEFRNATAMDHKPLGMQLDEIHVNAHGKNGNDGSHWQGETLRLSQIRHQARTKNQLTVQERIGGCTHAHFQGRTSRLSQIRHQARSKRQLLAQERIGKCTHRHLQGSITRLSQLRRQARSKNNLLVQEGIGECIHGCLDCRISEDNQREREASEHCETEETCQVGNLNAERVAAQQVTVEECPKDCSSSEVENMHEDHTHEGVSQSDLDEQPTSIVPCVDTVNADSMINTMFSKGRTRLTHLRHEARLGNSYLLARIHPGSLDTEESIDVSQSTS